MHVLREGPVKITKATIEVAWRRRAPEQRLMIGDAVCRGLALVVNRGGMTWRFDYKPRGADPLTGKRFSTRSVVIGSPETHSPEAARDAAGALKGQVKAGADPATARRVAIAAEAARRARTMGRLIEDYAAVLPARPKLRGVGAASTRHVAYELAYLRAAVTEMATSDKPVAEVGAPDIRSLLTLSADKPATARHRFGALSRFFDWAQDEGHVSLNPCALVAKGRRPPPVAARHDYLSIADLARLWHAAEEVESLLPVHRDLVRFLIAVPCRRGEAAGIDWAHLNLDAAEWRQPGKLTKNRHPHRMLLHPLALSILRERREAAGNPDIGLVFPAPRSGKALQTFSDMRSALGKAIPSGWRWHDFRRSFATALGERGVAEPVIDAMLNHKQSATRGGVLGVYQLAARVPEQRRAMELWGRLLAAAIEGRDAENGVVVEVRAAP